MIYDSIKHISAYHGIHPGIMRGLELLRDTDFAQLEDGRYQVEGDDLFFFLQSYETKSVNDTPEAHKKYADIMYMISGQEKIGVAPLEDMDQLVEAHPDSDISFYRGRLCEVLLTGDRFALFLPGDAHAPGVAPDAPAAVRKCVVKVRVG